jgi:hypothetical protein
MRESLVDELAAALSQAAEEVSEPEKKTKLRAIARDIAVGVIARRIGDL